MCFLRSAQQAEKLRILVDSYTSDEEVLHLIEVFNKRGCEQFRSTLRGMNKGDKSSSLPKAIAGILGPALVLIRDFPLWSLSSILTTRERAEGL